ncbi:MAG TPA: phosphatase PAP2 family protein [Streptosporangiaceae bacterium]
MFRYLIVLLWPAVIAVLIGGAYLLTRRSSDGLSGDGLTPRDGRRRHGHRGAGISSLRDSTTGAGQIILVAVVGGAVAVGVMSLLGLLVVHHGLTIDKPIFTWMQTHRVHVMKSLMERLTKIGDTWTTWGAAAAAAVCLAVTWREKRWVPPVALATLIVVDHFATLALRHEFERLGPPTSPLGTYPSGGCDRCIVFFGLIAYLLWREFSGRRATAIWAGAAVLALGFNEAYSRVYLSLHWFTDSLSGLLYGGLLLAGMIIAVQLVAGRPVQPLTDRQAEGVPAGLAAEDPVA